MDPVSLPAWLQAGGIVAFAGAVWFQLRRQGDALEKLQAAVVALLERDRMRSGPMRAITRDEEAITLNPPIRK